jgi:hypothetical protein
MIFLGGKIGDCVSFGKVSGLHFTVEDVLHARVGSKIYAMVTCRVES